MMFDFFKKKGDAPKWDVPKGVGAGVVGGAGEGEMEKYVGMGGSDLVGWMVVWGVQRGMLEVSDEVLGRLVQVEGDGGVIEFIAGRAGVDALKWWEVVKGFSEGLGVGEGVRVYVVGRLMGYVMDGLEEARRVLEEDLLNNKVDAYRRMTDAERVIWRQERVQAREAQARLDAELAAKRKRESAKAEREAAERMRLKEREREREKEREREREEARRREGDWQRRGAGVGAGAGGRGEGHPNMKWSRGELLGELGLSGAVGEGEIRRVYRVLAMKWHPDRVGEGEKEEAQRKFVRVKAAYELLVG